MRILKRMSDMLVLAVDYVTDVLYWVFNRKMRKFAIYAQYGTQPTELDEYEIKGNVTEKDIASIANMAMESGHNYINIWWEEKKDEE